MLMRWQIQTTFGRHFCSTPQIRPKTLSASIYKWCRLRTNGYIVGFYHNSPIPSDTPIHKIGAVGDGNTIIEEPLLPQYIECEIPEPTTAGRRPRLTHSVATLTDLKKVDVCRVGNRCTGLLINYYEAPPVVLGQWHTSQPSQHGCIFESSGRGLNTPTHVYFQTLHIEGTRKPKKGWQIEDYPGTAVVTDIRFSQLESNDGLYQSLSVHEVRSLLTTKRTYLLTVNSLLFGGFRNLPIRYDIGKGNTIVYHMSACTRRVRQGLDRKSVV